MLTKKQFDDLWDEFKKAMPKGNIPDYDEYIDSENMFEDYLDIFRGINTRMQRGSFSSQKWYYEHPFFQGDKAKLEKKPCIKYVMIGEARPKPNSPIFNHC
jgi:L-rhamnose mutarotase